MSTKENPPFARGTTSSSGIGTPGSTDNQQWEGTVWEFEDVNWATAGVKPSRSGRTVKCMVVRNASGIALLPKRLVKFKKSGGNPLQFCGQVDGYVSDNGGRGYPVDEFLPAAGVSNNDLFYIVIDGPAMCLMPLGPSEVAQDNTDIAIGAIIIGLSAATSQATSAGRVRVQNVTFSPGDTTGTTMANQIQFRIGYALSARVTTATNADVFVDIARW